MTSRYRCFPSGSPAHGGPLNRLTYFCEGLQILPVILSKLFADGMSRADKQSAKRDSDPCSFGDAVLAEKSEGKSTVEKSVPLPAKVPIFRRSIISARNKLTENKLTRIEVARYHFDEEIPAMERERNGNVFRAKFARAGLSRISRR